MQTLCHESEILSRKKPVYMGLVVGCLVIMFSGAVVAAPNVQAETTFTRSQAFGDWLLQCFETQENKGTKKERCSLTQGVGTEKVKLVASLSVVKAGKHEQESILRLTVPLGVSLKDNVIMKNRESLGHLQWLTCLNSGCLAEVKLDEKLLKNFKANNTLTLTAKTLRNQRDLILKFSLKGLNQGLSKIK